MLDVALIVLQKNQSATPLIQKRPPLPPQVANQHWENAVKRSESFSSIAPPLPPPPQCYPSNNLISNENNFTNQTMRNSTRKHVPMPNGGPVNHPPPAIPQRNMSSSVFNLSHGGFPQQNPGFPPHNAWGMHPMNQVSLKFKSKVQRDYFNQ